MNKVAHDIAFFEGLKSLAESAFPKVCRSCGKVFATADQFIAETQAVRKGISGLKASADESNSTIVEVYRNCSCGSTLMDFFSDRRDLSEAGQRRREIFNKLLPHLESKGLSRQQSREYLLRIMRGEASAADLKLIAVKDDGAP